MGIYLHLGRKHSKILVSNYHIFTKFDIHVLCCTIMYYSKMDNVKMYANKQNSV